LKKSWEKLYFDCFVTESLDGKRNAISFSNTSFVFAMRAFQPEISSCLERRT